MRGTSPLARAPPVDYVDKLPSRPWGIFTPPKWRIFAPPLTVLDGRNASTTDGVKQALGREPRDFGDYVRATAATGVWNRQG